MFPLIEVPYSKVCLIPDSYKKMENKKTYEQP